MKADNRKSRLVHVTGAAGSLWAFFGGQVAFMNRQGLEVHACASPGEYLDRFRAREQIPVHSVGIARPISPLRDLAAVVRLWRLLRRLRPDIVHAHMPKGGLLGMLAAWMAGVPVRVYTNHGLPLMTARGLKRLILRWAERVTCWLSHQVLCVGPSIRRVCVAERLCPESKIKVLVAGTCNGIDAELRFHPARVDEPSRLRLRASLSIPPTAPVLGFVGSLVPDKGIVELTAAWQVLREEFPALHLLLVGPPEAHAPLPAQTEAALRKDPRVHLTGMVAETVTFYSILDVCVLPTYREGFPNAPLEAAAMELPVVATRVPGCVDAVRDGITGTLVPPRDVPALTGTVARYLGDPELRRRHGRAGRQWVLRDFQPQAIWEALFQEYQRWLRKKGRPLPVPSHQVVHPVPSGEKKRAAA